MYRFVVVAGPPGAGKGTQCSRIARDIGCGHVSTGDALREEIEAGTDLGRAARARVDGGSLVPDAIVIEVFGRRLEAVGADLVLLDGFPRTLAQAELLEYEYPEAVQLVVSLVVPRAALVERLLGRDRHDDDRHAIGVRLLAFERDTRRMLSRYAARGLVAHVDGNRSPSEVTSAIMRALDTAGIMEHV
jgi:adenylate kinase